MSFQNEILEGIPESLPPAAVYNPDAPHAPRRKDILSHEQKTLALKNALRYFPTKWHETLAPEFAKELKDYGRIYMYRFKPKHQIFARPLQDYPAQSTSAAAIMLMIQNNLDPAVAQHPEELITYGGNGAVFQNWAQYRLTMQYLSSMTDEQTLHMYSGHPLGLFPSHPQAPRVIVTNGLMIPNYSKGDDWERYNALGVTQYGQMTAGSYMYIGPQGIVHGTTITLMNAFRRVLPGESDFSGRLFLTSGLGGMSGAQPKAGNIVGCVSVCADVSQEAARKRHAQGWVDELIDDLDTLVQRVRECKAAKETRSFAYVGNVVEVWERFLDEEIRVDVGSDQTSLHNPFAGGYYPAGLSFQQSQEMMRDDPDRFRKEVHASLRRQIAAINGHTQRGTYFFDYGNAFLLECSRAGAAICKGDEGDFIYPSYVQDILGPMCFDYGFGPFRWVCSSGEDQDLDRSDAIAAQVLRELAEKAPTSIALQMQDNIRWIEQAKSHALVVGSKARILYADAQGRRALARRFNQAIAKGEISGPIVLGRDHHDVGGTDSPYRETSNIRDGSRFTADMATHNFVGGGCRGASWISLHNGGGVGWGEVINGGFGLVLDGSKDAGERADAFLLFDVNNGVARRSWARNPGAREAIEEEMRRTPGLRITLAENADEQLVEQALS